MREKAVRRQREALAHYERCAARSAERGHPVQAASWERVVSAERMVLRRMEAR